MLLQSPEGLRRHDECSLASVFSNILCVLASPHQVRFDYRLHTPSSYACRAPCHVVSPWWYAPAAPDWVPPRFFFSGSPRTKTRAGPAGQHQVLLTCRLDRSSSYVSRSLSRPVSRPVCEGTQLGSTPKQGRCAVLACHRSKQDPLGAGSPRRKVCAKFKPAQHKHPQKLPPVVVRNQSDTPAGGSLYHPSPRPCASCVSAPWFIDTVSRALTIAYPSCGASWLSRHAR